MKNVLVTGASSGIGEATARLFAEQGYRVMGAGRDPGRLAQLAAGNENISTWSGDITDSSQCNALVAHTVAEYGGIDVLVNSAGIIQMASVADTDDELWRATMAVNLDATFYLSRAALPHLLARRGAIINLGSDWSIDGAANASAYCASKGAIVLLSKAMAVEHAAAGLRVNAVCPGNVDTPMLHEEAKNSGMGVDEAIRQWDAESPTGRITRAEEVAALILYLASDAARQITGTAIPIDGGITAG